MCVCVCVCVPACVRVCVCMSVLVFTLEYSYSVLVNVKIDVNVSYISYIQHVSAYVYEPSMVYVSEFDHVSLTLEVYSLFSNYGIV